MIFACGKTALLHCTALDGEVCNYIPLNNWNRCPPAISSSNWMFNITSLYVSYILHAVSLAVISRRLLKYDSTVNRCRRQLGQIWTFSGPQMSVLLAVTPLCLQQAFSSRVSWHHDLQGCCTYLRKGEVFWSLCTHKLPLGFMSAVAEQVLSVHYHSSIAFCFHDVCPLCEDLSQTLWTCICHCAFPIPQRDTMLFQSSAYSKQGNYSCWLALTADGLGVLFEFGWL